MKLVQAISTTSRRGFSRKISDKRSDSSGIVFRSSSPMITKVAVPRLNVTSNATDPGDGAAGAIYDIVNGGTDTTVGGTENYLPNFPYLGVPHSGYNAPSIAS